MKSSCKLSMCNEGGLRAAATVVVGFVFVLAFFFCLFNFMV